MKITGFAFTILFAAGLLGSCTTGVTIAPPAQTATAPSTALATGLATPGPGGPTGTPRPIPFPASTVILAWHREGGIAGYCDDLRVLADGSFTATNCVTIPGTLRNGQLDADQLRQLAAWVNTFQSFAISDGQRIVAPDAMIQKTAFTGAGMQPAGPADRAAIGGFAALLVVAPPPVDPGNTPQAVLSARDYLARELDLPVEDVSIVSFGFVQWPDRCLGVVVLGEMCAQGVTPGYQVILGAQAQLYELHTDESGESIRQVR